MWGINFFLHVLARKISLGFNTATVMHAPRPGYQGRLSARSAAGSASQGTLGCYAA